MQLLGFTLQENPLMRGVSPKLNSTLLTHTVSKARVRSQLVLWLLLHLCNVFPVCSINSEMLCSHNLHLPVCIDRIKWLQPWLKLTALHINQGTQYQSLVPGQWWVVLTFMSILSQFSLTLTTLHWLELSNRQLNIGNICQILHLDSMVHFPRLQQYFAWGKRTVYFN